MKDLFVNTQLPVVTSDRILYTPSNFARTSLLYLQEIGSLQVHKPHSTGRSNLSSYLFFTVTLHLFVIPLDFTVMVTFPAFFALITPLEDTAAILVFEDL